MMDKLIELAAQAIFASNTGYRDTFGLQPWTWDLIPTESKDHFRREARAALSAIKAAGMRIVPSETLPILHGNGVEDDTAALQAMAEGKPYVDETK